MENIIDRFIRYVKIDTQSDSSSKNFPSTERQKVLLKLLHDEMIEMGLEDVDMDEYGYVMGTIPATVSKNIPTIGFISHVDTSPDFCGKGVNPQIIQYVNGDIIINRELNIVLKESELVKYRNQELITTDGTTLLGADDKAGVAEIMSAAEHLINNPDIKHGKIRIAFTPDEEIGRGVDLFSVERFGAKYAYTLDGGHCGELEYENFNAASAEITIQGRSIHPGYAKGKMINALNIAHEIQSLLPIAQRAEHTEHREGFFHLHSLNGNVDSASMSYIIRNHSREQFESQKEHLTSIVKGINDKFKEEIIKLEINDQYYNMREVVEQHYEVVQKAIDAMKAIDITPEIKPIRGGTDGSKLSFMGLPCPNIFAGGVNYHGPYEFIATQTMIKAKELIIQLSKQWAQH